MIHHLMIMLFGARRWVEPLLESISNVSGVYGIQGRQLALRPAGCAQEWRAGSFSC